MVLRCGEHLERPLNIPTFLFDYLNTNKSKFASIRYAVLSFSSSFSSSSSSSSSSSLAVRIFFLFIYH
jgi:hypothetical protein